MTHTEVLVCLSCDSREQVDERVRRAVAACGSTYSEPQDPVSCTNTDSRTRMATSGN